LLDNKCQNVPTMKKLINDFFPSFVFHKGGKAAVGVAYGFEAMASPTAKIEDVLLRLVAYIQTQR
jgi:hypothetical protein